MVEFSINTKEPDILSLLFFIHFQHLPSSIKKVIELTQDFLHKTASKF